MATTNELLEEIEAEMLSGENDIFVVDNNFRTVSIPESMSVLGVEHDDDVHRLYFQIPKMYGDTDLSDFKIRINYMNAAGKGDVYPVTDNEVSGENISFSWLVGRSAFEQRGDVVFVVCLRKIDDEGNVIKEFNTTLMTLPPVLEGLETSELVIQDNPDIIEQILARLDDLEENGGGGTVDPEQIKQAVNGYLEENPVSGMTAEQEQQLDQNTTDVADLKSDLEQKLNKSGWTPGKYLGTDSDGNIVVKNVPDDSEGSTELSSQNLIDSTQYKNSGYSGTLFDEFQANRNVFDSKIDTSENKILYFRVYRNNVINSYNVDMSIACYDSNEQYLFTMKANNEYSDNFEQISSVIGTVSEPVETIENISVSGKIIALVSIPENVYKVKFGIWAAGPMPPLFYPAFAVSYKPITNYGSITEEDYSLTQGDENNGSESSEANSKPLINKILLMIGDSLTNWGGGGDNSDGFLKIIHDRTGITTVNWGLAGATWEEADGQTQPGVTRVDTYVSGAVRYDCIAFLLGTNVANQGEVTDTSETKTTMCGAIKYCLEQLITLSPTTPIIVFLPPQRAEGNTEQKARNDIIKQICEIYGVYTFDLYARSQVIPNTTVSGNGTLSDGLHLSEKGQENFGRIMSTAILDVMGY